MKNKTQFCLSTIAYLLAAFAICLSCVSCTYAPGTPHASEKFASIADIKKDLPVGTSKAEVISYFQKKGIDCEPDAPPNSIVARLDGVSHFLTNTEDVVIQIKLDNKGDVTDVSVQKFVTGL